MSTYAAPIFDAALALPRTKSLNQEFPPAQARTPEEWTWVINDRCDAVDRGEEELLDGDQAIGMLRKIAHRVEQSP